MYPSCINYYLFYRNLSPLYVKIVAESMLRTVATAQASSKAARGETMKRLSVMLLSVLCIPGSSGAQERTENQFSGAYAGPEVTAVDHHFTVEDVGASAGPREDVTRWGIGGGTFAGYMAPVASRLLIGGEAGVFGGGRTPRYADGATTVALKPRWGYSLVARAGYTPAAGTMLFVEGGYGAHRYSVRATQDVDVEAIGDSWTRSFVVGGGVEQVLSRRISMRARFQHLDGTRNQFMVGIPIRF